MAKKIKDEESNKVKDNKKKKKSLGNKRKREKEQNLDLQKAVTVNTEEKDSGRTKREKRKDKLLRKKKRKDEEQSASRSDQLGIEVKDYSEKQNGILKKSGKHKRKGEKTPEKREEVEVDDVYMISSGDEDCSKGMRKWVTEYHQSRPGLKILQQGIDEFITTHQERLEEEKKEREARASEGGWTVVVHHKGRKKTTDSESGVTVGSVAQAVVEDKMAKRKQKEVGDFYRFQRREAKRNEIMVMQSKFEQDRKRIQQLRAARKFRPY